MIEYIQREAALKTVAEWLDPVAGIESIPVADVAHVRHGEWEAKMIGHMRCWLCSLCGYVAFEETPYCPGCGAKMDLGVLDDDDI